MWGCTAWGWPANMERIVQAQVGLVWLSDWQPMQAIGHGATHLAVPPRKRQYSPPAPALGHVLRPPRVFLLSFCLQAMGDARSAEYMKGRRIMEVNPGHPIIQALKAKVELESRWAWVAGRWRTAVGRKMVGWVGCNHKPYAPQSSRWPAGPWGRIARCRRRSTPRF